MQKKRMRADIPIEGELRRDSIGDMPAGIPKILSSIFAHACKMLLVIIKKKRRGPLFLKISL